MTKFIGNTNHIINWQDVVDSLSQQEPGYVGPRHSSEDDIIGIREMAKLWDKAGFTLIKDGGNAGWDMFFPDIHFDRNIVNTFADYLNVTAVDCWISRVNPGNLTPWHWDCNDNEDEYRKMNINRYSCNISKPAVGHAVMIEDDCITNQQQGNVWQWTSRTSWHGGVNFGFTPKYLLNFSGIPK
jgi:hypothetical protein